MFRAKHLVPLVISVSLLAACGGGDGNGGSSPPQMPSRGQLVNNPPTKLGSFPVSDLVSRLSVGTMGQALLQLLSPICSVDTYHLEYGTVGARGEAATASAALMVPTGSDPKCQGPRPRPGPRGGRCRPRLYRRRSELRRI